MGGSPPSEWFNYKRKGAAHFQLMQYDKALESIAKAVELNPNDSSNLTWIPPAAVAKCPDEAFKKGVLELADCEKAVEVQPAGKREDLSNYLAWHLATCADRRVWKADLAVKLAKKAVELAPQEGMYWNTLGAAQYRAGDYKAAIEALTKSMELRTGGDAFDWFFLAMAHWQSGSKEEARSWYDKAAEWTTKNKPDDEELVRFRAEAAELLGIPVTPPEEKEETDEKPKGES